MTSVTAVMTCTAPVLRLGEEWEWSDLKYRSQKAVGVNRIEQVFLVGAQKGKWKVEPLSMSLQK